MTPAGEPVAAYVGTHVITVAQVDQRLAALRTGAFGSRLPSQATAEGRNARRWVLQLLCAEQVVSDELARRRTAPAGARAPLALPRALAVGGVAAAVLAAIPESVGLIEQPVVGDAEVRAYYQRNRDLYPGVCFADARAAIMVELAGAASDRAFGSWLEQRMAADVVLSPGFEHPAAPGHPDSTHRH